MKIEQVRAERGWIWFKEAWAIFRAAPWTWILMTLLFFGIVLSGELVNTIGDAVSSTLEPVLLVGIFLACRAQVSGKKPELSQLFEGFKAGRVLPLLGLGLLDFGSSEILSRLGRLVLLQGEAWSELLKSEFWRRFFADADTWAILKFCFFGAFGTTLYIVLGAAFWFAPALIGLGGCRFGEALRESFLGVMRNFPAMLVYAFATAGFAILASVPLYLGLLAFLPVFIVTGYVSYREIFVQDLSSATPSTLS